MTYRNSSLSILAISHATITIQDKVRAQTRATGLSLSILPKNKESKTE